MPPEDKEVREAAEKPRESGSDERVSQLARDGQEKPKELQELDKLQAERRANRLTPSSVDLPAFSLSIEDGQLMAKVADKLYTVGEDGRVSKVRQGAEEGAIGNRAKDSGVSTLDKPEYKNTTVAGKELPASYTTPDGQKYTINYGGDGKPNSVSLPNKYGEVETYEKKGGEWLNPKDPEKRLKDVVVDDKGRVAIVQTDHATQNDSAIRIGANGTLEKLKYYDAGNPDKYPEKTIDKDGNVHEYSYSGDSRSGEVITRGGSHIGEVKDADGKTKGYDIKDDQGHVRHVAVDDKGVTLKRGDSTEHYDKAEFKDGKLTLTAKDKSTTEIAGDGMEIHRNPKQQVTEIINSDGERTTFKKGAAGIEATVTDGQGKVVETNTKVIEGPTADGTYKIARGKDEVVERKADGTERHLDKDGKEVKSEADKLMEKFKSSSPEEQRQLRQDLADIDRLPKEQREKVYAALDKIAHNDEHPGDKIKLTPQQEKELVTSLAHQIAHPESIQQGAHETCAAANMEELAARNHPDVYADMVASLATQGEYKTAGGKMAYAQTHGATLDAKVDAYGTRSYTSELFQDAAVDLGLRIGNDPPLRYKLVPLDSPEIQPRPIMRDKDGKETGTLSPSADYGERVINPNHPNRPERFSGLSTDEQIKALHELFPQDKIGTMKPINTPADLQKALDANGGPPMKVGFSLRGEKFTGMGDESGTLSGSHAVVITKIENGKVYFENTAGGKDHSYPNGEGVPAKEFTEAMKAGKRGAFVKGKWPEGSQPDRTEVEGSSGIAHDAPVAAPARDGHAQAIKGDAGPMKGDAGPKGDGGHERQAAAVGDEPPKADPGKLKEIHDNPQVKKEREALEKDLKGLDVATQARFTESMRNFENRAAVADPPLKPDEVAKTIKEIRTLVETPDAAGQPLKKVERINVAEQVLKHAADPTGIDQGNHNTCNVTTIESRMFSREPSKAAEMIARLSIDGTYESHGSPAVKVHLDREKLKGGNEESNNPPKDGDRSHASKIFQAGAIAISHEKYGVTVRDADNKVIKEYPPGSIEYRSGEPKAGGKDPNDTGEELIDKKTGQPVKDATDKVMHGPALDDDHIANTYNDITGTQPPEKGIYLVDDKYIAGDGKHVSRIKTEEDLKRELEAAQGPPGKYPIIVGVNTGQEPFFTDSKGGYAGGSGGGHVVTITSYDAKTGQVKIDNQWGQTSDHSVSIHDLRKSMMTTGDAITELDKEVAKNRQEGVVDRAREIELLRLKHNSGQMTDQEYDKHIIFIAQQAVKEAKDRDNLLDRHTREELRGAFNTIAKDERRMQEIRKGVNADVVKRVVDEDSLSVVDINLPANYNTKDMQAAADVIFKAKGVLHDDTNAVYDTLGGKSPEEIAQMEKAFQDKHHMSMESYLMSFMDKGIEQDLTRALLAKAHGNPLPASQAKLPFLADDAAPAPTKGGSGPRRRDGDT